MKQKVILLIVLAFGICCINVCAQTKKPVRRTTTQTKRTTTRSTQQGGQLMKFKQVAEDGYVWYKLKRGNLYGVRDSEGNDIIPIKYSFVDYIVSEYDGTHFFYVANGDYKGAYTREGTCVIPTNLHYTGIGLQGTSNWICWNVDKNGSQGILDARGKEVIPPIYDSLLPRQIFVNGGERGNEWFFLVKKNNMYGLSDLDGNFICPIQYNFIYYVSYNNGSFEMNCKDTEASETRFISISYSSKTRFDYQPFESLFFAFSKQSSSPSNISSNISNSTVSSSSTNSSSTSNSGNKTTTVVVEHHRDPVPVQEWQQCPACYGSGQCPNVQCGGSGWYYIGDRRSLCSRCHGSGKCTTCAGRGGQNVTVYR